MSLTLNQIVDIAATNTEFAPGMPSNEIFYANQTSERLTDVIATVAAEVLDKADEDHTHTGYAAVDHSHTGYADADHSHEGYAAADHSHTGYATADHAHTGYATAEHTHTPAAIGAAEASHTHDYAASNHGHSYNDLSDKPTIPAAYTHPESHPASMITGLAEVATSGSYDDLTDKPTIPAAYSHPTSHPASMITGLSEVATSGSYEDLTDKPTIPAAYTHPDSHPTSMITGLEDALAAKADASVISTKADLVDGKVPTSQLPAFVDDVLEFAALSGFPTAGESGKIYVALDTNKTYRWSGTGYVEISASIALGETAATAYRGDRGKTAYDHSQNSTVHVTAAQKTAWDGKAAGDHVHSYNDLTDKPTIPTIPDSLPANGGNADTVDGKHATDFATATHTHSGYAASGHTHTASDVGAAAAAHTHTAASIGAASASHTHSEYAASNHGHSDYASSGHTHTAADVGAVPTSGGTVSGALTVTGAATIKGKAYTQQILPFDGGSYSIGSADYRYYSTYLRVNPNVSSDRRCKRDIVTMDIDTLAAFVGKRPVVSYNYNDDADEEEKRIGLIAQDLIAADSDLAKSFVEQDEQGFFSLRPADLVFPLIAAVQALAKRVEELEGK